MSTAEVKTITLNKPFTVAGKIFKGDYAKSSGYITEVQDELLKSKISIIQNKVLGVYYDNPQEKKADDLRSFQGAFLENENAEVPASLEKLFLKGKYLHVQITGDPMKAIYEGYGSLFNHIQNNNLTLRSNAGYQVSTFENGVITTEIYRELS